MRFLCVLLMSAACALGAGELSGRRAPGFSLPDSAGKQYDPLDYRGKVILFDCGQVSYSYLKPTSQNIVIPHVFLIDAEGMIRNDFGFGPETMAIFEGKALFAELDKMLAPKPAKK